MQCHFTGRIPSSNVWKAHVSLTYLLICIPSFAMIILWIPINVSQKLLTDTMETLTSLDVWCNPTLSYEFRCLMFLLFASHNSLLALQLDLDIHASRNCQGVLICWSSWVWPQGTRGRSHFRIVGCRQRQGGHCLFRRCHWETCFLHGCCYGFPLRCQGIRMAQPILLQSWWWRMPNSQRPPARMRRKGIHRLWATINTHLFTVQYIVLLESLSRNICKFNAVVETVFNLSRFGVCDDDEFP